MGFLPYEKYILQTKLSRQQIISRLRKEVEPGIAIDDNLGFGASPTQLPYRGRINADGFAINRVISYRNSFLPVIKGKFIENPLGHCDIKIVMRPVILVLVFIGFWLTGVGAAALIFLVVQVASRPDFVLFIPTFMFIAGYSLMFFGFSREKRKAKDFLQQLFEASETPAN